MTVAPLAGIISSYSSLAIPGAWLIIRPAHTSRLFRLLILYAIIAFVGDRIPEVVGHNGTVARGLSFLFTIVEYTFFTLFFYHFFERKTNRWLVIGGSVIFLITLTVELEQFGLLYYSRYNAGMAVILIIGYSFLLFHEWLTDDPLELIYAKADFWITLGCLVYLSGSFFFFITVGRRWEQNWILHSVCNLIKNVLFTVAMIQSFPGPAPKKTF